MSLDGRNVIVTGASQGLGKSIAAACVKAGANVLMCARDEKFLEQARRETAEHAAAGQVVLAQRADVADESDVQRLFETAAAKFATLHGLVNNAGVYGPKGLLEEVDLHEWSDAIRINLMGVVLTSRHALPIFRRQGYGKLINLSGGGATSPLPRISAYAASKAAVVRLTETMAEETAGTGIDINAVAPGALNTRLLEEILSAGPEKVGVRFYENALKQKASGGAPLEKGTDLCVFLLSSASDGISGRLISAVWDPWQELGDRRDQLRGSDIYTLRRIVPKDRGQNWG